MSMSHPVVRGGSVFASKVPYVPYCSSENREVNSESRKKENTRFLTTMKIVRKDLVPDGPGSVKMVPVDSDDLWYAYNLIAPGDSVMAVTVRKVLREVASGGRDAERVKLKLEIKVEEIADYDTLGSVLRIRGKNILENEYVKIGAFHTLELELHRPFVLRKAVLA
ncbi:Protein pelota [Morella rubra]|uniref:Protein pelota n=1 Tax=Morella rubra TaxID=262757 RepID=A0A6A1V9W8_9ROSI|nr:Protein pelota [Morella rubra]